MAVPTVRAVGTGTTVNGTAITPVIPTHDTDDILLCFVESTRYSDTLTCSTTGWAEVADSPQFSSFGPISRSVRLAVFWKRAASAAETNPTVAGASDQVSAVVISFTGCRTSDPPWDVTSGGDTAGVETTSASAPGDTTTVADCLVVIAIATSRDNLGTAEFSGWTNADLASVTERYDGTFGTSQGGGLGIATGAKAVAGAYGATTATTAAASVLAYMTIALTATSSTTAIIDLEWDDLAAIEDGFKIELSTDGGAYSQIDTVAADVTTYQDTVNTGHTYAYRVRSYNANGNSAYSNVSTVVVP